MTRKTILQFLALGCLVLAVTVTAFLAVQHNTRQAGWTWDDNATLADPPEITVGCPPTQWCGPFEIVPPPVAPSPGYPARTSGFFDGN